jgi:uncharacterized membrane protein (DUF485 family)
MDTTHCPPQPGAAYSELLTKRWAISPNSHNTDLFLLQYVTLLHLTSLFIEMVGVVLTSY